MKKIILILLLLFTIVSIAESQVKLYWIDTTGGVSRLREVSSLYPLPVRLIGSSTSGGSDFNTDSLWYYLANNTTHNVSGDTATFNHYNGIESFNSDSLWAYLDTTQIAMYDKDGTFTGTMTFTDSIIVVDIKGTNLFITRTATIDSLILGQTTANQINYIGGKGLFPATDYGANLGIKTGSSSYLRFDTLWANVLKFNSASFTTSANIYGYLSYNSIYTGLVLPINTNAGQFGRWNTAFDSIFVFNARIRNDMMVDSVLSAKSYKQNGVIAILDSTINGNESNIFSKTLSGNQRFVFTNIGDGQTINVAVTNTTDNFAVEWINPDGLTIKWTGGTPPTQTIGDKTDVYTFIRIGSNIFGTYIQNF